MEAKVGECFKGNFLKKDSYIFRNIAGNTDPNVLNMILLMMDRKDNITFYDYMFLKRVNYSLN